MLTDSVTEKKTVLEREKICTLNTKKQKRERERQEEEEKNEEEENQLQSCELILIKSSVTRPAQHAEPRHKDSQIRGRI